MKKSLRSDNQGIAHLAVLLGVVVIVVIAGVGYLVFSKQKKTSDSATPATSAAASAVVDACVKAYNDKDLCKFSGSYNANVSYKATFASVDKVGKKTTMSTETDGKGNSSTVTDGSAFISLNGDTYMKAAGETTWTKYPKSKDASAATASENPTSDLKIDTQENKPDDQKITYKKLGKEACGNATCFKYQVIDPSQPGTESIVWFGDKDYQLHKWSFKDKDNSTSVGEFNYTSVTISVPSPVTDAPAAPSQADIQKMIDQAQQNTGTDQE